MVVSVLPAKDHRQV
ncbi:extensin [Iris pallida]|uniref:Extensin n=1 Tax=Iris pallida TaxID=29817 RepID=A0AAX6FR34_IRIPA|nr:extensin [Iris pallida]